MKLYERLSHELSERIQQGYYQPGDKLPSIRELQRAHQVSMSTAQKAYLTMEEEGWICAKPKSGYYVNAQQQPPAMPPLSRPDCCPMSVEQWEDVLNLLLADGIKENVTLSRGLPDIRAASLKPLLRLIAQSVSLEGCSLVRGDQQLRGQIARLMIDGGCRVHPDDVIITSGCQEALQIAMRSVLQAGDVIAVESPSFYGVMQTCKSMGVKALEIPTHPETGISLEALELALEQWPIKAIQLTPSFQNPLGYSMPAENRQRLVAMANKAKIAIIEDDVYGDLAYHGGRPPSIKSFDTEGRVILCSSFSKTVAPSLRVGWIAPGKYYNRALHHRYVSTAYGANIQQAGLAEFVAQGYYERHLRKIRVQYLHNRDAMIALLKKHLPDDTKISYPQGGFILWVQLDERIDTTMLNRELSEQGISIAPGEIFSATGKYTHCMRLNYAEKLTDKIREAIAAIGVAIQQQLSS